MGNGLEAFGRSLDGFDNVLQTTHPDVWEQLSPCPPWTARDVTGHVIGGLLWVGQLISGESEAVIPAEAFESGPGVMAGPDPLATWLTARHDFVTACTPEAMERKVRWPFGEQMVDKGLGWFSLEPLIHTWDLASATGRNVRLDAELVHQHLVRLRPLSEHLRGPGAYGPELEVRADVDEQDQLLAFLGRRT
ncbi:MAG: TIGR03086 family metal-binding protein [Acidimicrobiales bacterium]